MEPINWSDVLIKFIITLPAIIFAFAAWRTSKSTHKQVNGRMDEYKKLLIENAELRFTLLNNIHTRKDDREKTSPNSANTAL